MRRTLNVIRLQLINRSTFLWTPAIVLGAAVAMSILVYVLIPSGEPKYGIAAGQAPLWVFLSIGISAMTLTFPFSQAISITRREFFLGTMAAAVLGSALMGGLFLIGGALEKATGGYGLNGWTFYLPWLWEAGPVGAFAVYFTLALFFFVMGFTGATVYKRWGAVTLTTAGVGLALVVIGLVFLATRLELWGQVGVGVAQLGAFGLALCGLAATVALMGVSFLMFRRTLP